MTLELDEHFFRREAGRMVAALTRIFGVHNLALAEDVVQDAFCRALDVWKVSGVPENPSAWLMATAKNRALDVIRRERTARRFAPEMGRLLETEWTLAPLVHEAFAAHTMRDEQLRMMFSCCHPQLAEEAQLALILNILCGFGAGEIASAFLTGRAAIEKRISRGKKVLAGAKRLFDLGDAEFALRLATVRRALYLLFNEGYHGASGGGGRARRSVRRGDAADGAAARAPAGGDARHQRAGGADVPARGAAAGARRRGRRSRAGWSIRTARAGTGGWSTRGSTLLQQSAAGSELSAYHIEAGIAATHAGARTLADTDWRVIVVAVRRLMAMSPSPVVALNRAIAIGQRDGADSGLAGAGGHRR